MRTIVSSLVLALAVSLPASAQQATSALRGKVVDAQQGVLPGVTITVRNQDTGMFRTLVSGTDGSYLVSALVPGVYEVSATLQGFNGYQRRDVLLEVGRTVTLDITLQVGNVAETVTVTAESPVVDLTSKQVGGHVTAADLVQLPSVNRNFVGFVGLLPGIVPSISTESFGSDSVTVNGTDPRNNNYLLDGGNNNDDVIGQRAGTQARTPIEAVQEFQVVTNQFDAEFGRTTGAIINAITKQGTNQWRGAAFSYFKDASMTKRNFFAIRNDSPKPDTSEQQFGGTLGGPILRDRAHVFASVERVLIDEGITVNIPTRPDLNTTTTEETRVWNTVVRFDHQINANHTWGVRWLREYSPQFNQIIGNVALGASREEDDTDQTVVGTLTSVLGGTRVNTVRAVWTQEDVSFGNPCYNGNGRNQAACAPTLAFQTFTDQQSNVAQSRVNDAYQLEDTLSWFIPGRRGDHDVKMGVQYQYSRSNNFNDGNLNGTFSFGRNDQPFNPDDPTTYPDRFSIRVPGASFSRNEAQYLAVFLQDKWKLTPRLTVSLGLRYDLEALKLNETDNPRFADPSDYPVDTNNVAPRLGFAWDFAGDGMSVVRGGYGRFYEKTHFELVNGIQTASVFSDSFNRNFPLSAADSGPRNGLLPTDPFLAGGPVVNRDLLESMFPAGTTLRNTGTVVWDDPDRVMPYTDQVTVGYSRQLRSDIGVSVDYVHAAARDLLLFRDLNPGLRETTDPTSTLVRVGSAELDAAFASLSQQHAGFAPFASAVLLPVNAGETDYDALMLQVDKRYRNNWSARLSYTLSYSRGNTPGVRLPTSGFQVLDDLNLALNEGPTNLDRRHNIVLSGMVLVPYARGVTLSWVARGLSGTPFTLFDGDVDLDRNGSQAEPLPAGSYAGTGDLAYVVDDYEPQRNGAYGPGFFQLDLRAGYRFDLQGARLDAFVEVFNVTNRTNFANPTGNLASPNFLVLTGTSTSTTPRLVQLGFRYAF